MISFSAVKIHQSIHKNIFPCRVHSSRFYTVNTLVKKYKTYGSLQSYNCHWNSPYTPLHTVQCCTLLLFIFQNVNIPTDKSASHCHWSTFISFININHFPPIPDLSELRPWPVWAVGMCHVMFMLLWQELQPLLWLAHVGWRWGARLPSPGPGCCQATWPADQLMAAPAHNLPPASPPSNQHTSVPT